MIAAQLIRSGTSVAANYRAACRSRSRADFISKIGVVEEEADETALWLELIVADKILPLPTEANELVAIMAASFISARQNGSARRAVPTKSARNAARVASEAGLSIRNHQSEIKS